VSITEIKTETLRNSGSVHQQKTKPNKNKQHIGDACKSGAHNP